MLPLIQGIIARRMLLNFRADPEVVQRLLPSPLEVDRQSGYAVVGICLIRLEHLRPPGFPAALGFSCENMAHRVAIRYPGGSGMREGVYIWRRETDKKLIEFAGGRIFPGVHHQASFQVEDNPDQLSMDVITNDGAAAVRFTARPDREWHPTAAFSTFEAVSEFFRKGDCGFSCSSTGDELEGLQLKTLQWNMTPMRIESQHCTFYSDPQRFPAGSIEFDSGLLMRGIPHEWHNLTDIPQLAATN